MTEEHKTPGAAEPPVMAQNFIHDFIDEDIAQAGSSKVWPSTPASRPNPTATSTSACQGHLYRLRHR